MGILESTVNVLAFIVSIPATLLFLGVAGYVIARSCSVAIYRSRFEYERRKKQHGVNDEQEIE